MIKIMKNQLKNRNNSFFLVSYLKFIRLTTFLTIIERSHLLSIIFQLIILSFRFQPFTKQMCEFIFEVLNDLFLVVLPKLIYQQAVILLFLILWETEIYLVRGLLPPGYILLDIF